MSLTIAGPDVAAPVASVRGGEQPSAVSMSARRVQMSVGASVSPVSSLPSTRFLPDVKTSE